MNTYEVNTYHVQTDDIDLWCQYKFADKDMGDGKTELVSEWQGEMQIKLPNGKALSLTKEEAILIFSHMHEFSESVTDKAIDVRIDQLQKEQLAHFEKMEQQLAEGTL